MTTMTTSSESFDGKEYPLRWTSNSPTCQNMNSDQVDWAALAQQWIKMKENAAPPAPQLSQVTEMASGCTGEAPMDMDTKDDDSIPSAPPPPTISGTADWNQWSQFGSQWNQNSNPSVSNWDWTVPPPDVKSLPPPSTTNKILIPPPAPVISNTRAYLNQIAPPPDLTKMPPTIPPAFPFNSMPPAPFCNQQVPSNAMWNARRPPLNVPPPPFIRGPKANNRMPMIPPNHAIPIPKIQREVKEKSPEEEFFLDAARRKQLPAWIREGLEKMEREKQRAIEREQEEILRQQELEERKKAQEHAREVLNPSKSKFDSDSEKDPEVEIDNRDDEEEPVIVRKPWKKVLSGARTPEILKPRKSRFHDSESSERSRNLTPPRPSGVPVKEKSKESVLSHPKHHVNREEMLENLMLKVRRSLTEILLEVTNNEISAVCSEVWKRSHNKASTGETRSSNNTAPLAQITRKLGLGIYGDSSGSESGNDSSDRELTPPPRVQEFDSEDELKESLRRKQQAFRKVEEEIEAQIARELERNKAEEESDSLDSEADEPVDRRPKDGTPEIPKRPDRKMSRDGDDIDDKKVLSKWGNSKGNSSGFNEVNSERAKSYNTSPRRKSSSFEKSVNRKKDGSESDADSADSKRRDREKRAAGKNNRDKGSEAKKRRHKRRHRSPSRSSHRGRRSRSRSKSNAFNTSSNGGGRSRRSSSEVSSHSRASKKRGTSSIKSFSKRSKSRSRSVSSRASSRYAKDSHRRHRRHRRRSGSRSRSRSPHKKSSRYDRKRTRSRSRSDKRRRSRSRSRNSHRSGKKSKNSE